MDVLHLLAGNNKVNHDKGDPKERLMLPSSLLFTFRGQSGGGKKEKKDVKKKTKESERR